MRFSLRERAANCFHPLAQSLFKLMEKKQSNLALSADVTCPQKLLSLAATLGPEICVLKTHIDILDHFSETTVQELKALAKEHQFLIFEDRKFADIGQTVQRQFAGGIFQIAKWADIINAHSISGIGTIQGLQKAAAPHAGLLLIAEMSSEKHLMDKTYQNHTLQMAYEFKDFVMGFITQHALNEDPTWINFAPGIHFTPASDGLGQNYVTPEKALEKGADILIVGRAILNATDPLATARRYRAHLWQCYTQ